MNPTNLLKALLKRILKIFTGYSFQKTQSGIFTGCQENIEPNFLSSSCAILVEKSNNEVEKTWLVYKYLYQSRLKAIIEKYNINLIIDVGANEGQFATLLRAIGYQNQIISFEPVSSAFFNYNYIVILMFIKHMVILGAKGLAKELLTVLYHNAFNKNIVFFDDFSLDIPNLLFEQFQILRSWEELESYFINQSPDFLIGVGGSTNRKSLTKKAISKGGKLSSLISNHAIIGNFGNKIYDGVCILSGATVTVDVEIGTGTLVNKNAIISHDVKIGEYCEISPGAKILGRATIGNGTEIGANAVILPNINVGHNCKVGAGAVVTKNVTDGQTVIGVPAKPSLT